MKKKAVFLGNAPRHAIDRVYPEDLKQRMGSRMDLGDTVIGQHNYLEPEAATLLREAEVAFSTWGMPVFSEEEIARTMPNLKAVFFGAGSVQLFARPFLARGVRIVSAWQANAVPVAQYAVAQLLLANKGFYQSITKTKVDRAMADAFSSTFPGNYRVRVGLLGIGAIGSRVAELLKPYGLEVLAYDPFLPKERAEALSLVMTELDEIFTTCQTISNHLANLPATVGMLHGKHFHVMLPNATFLNTGRGAQIVEADLAQALVSVPTRTAVLDVTDPEPMLPDNPLFELPNVFLTPHIAGSSGREVVRMGEWMFEEFGRYALEEPLLYEVTSSMLHTMA